MRDHYRFEVDQCKVAIPPGKPGDIIEAIPIAGQGDSYQDTVCLLCATMKDAEHYAQFNHGYYGSRIVNDTITVICGPTGEWSPVVPMKFHDDVKPEGYDEAKAREKALERAKDRMSEEDLKILGIL